MKIVGMKIHLLKPPFVRWLVPWFLMQVLLKRKIKKELNGKWKVETDVSTFSHDQN
jgi:hypothetical protein